MQSLFGILTYGMLNLIELHTHTHTHAHAHMHTQEYAYIAITEVKSNRTKKLLHKNIY